MLRRHFYETCIREDGGVVSWTLTVTCMGSLGKVVDVTLKARERRWRVRKKKAEKIVVTTWNEIFLIQLTLCAHLFNSLEPVAEPALGKDHLQVVLVVAVEQLYAGD